MPLCTWPFYSQPMGPWVLATVLSSYFLSWGLVGSAAWICWSFMAMHVLPCCRMEPVVPGMTTREGSQSMLMFSTTSLCRVTLAISESLHLRESTWIGVVVRGNRQTLLIRTCLSGLDDRVHSQETLWGPTRPRPTRNKTLPYKTLPIPVLGADKPRTGIPIQQNQKSLPSSVGQLQAMEGLQESGLLS